MKKLPVFLLFGLVLAACGLGAQSPAIQVGQMSGDSVSYVTPNWWLQVNVPNTAAPARDSFRRDLNQDGIDDVELILTVWGLDVDSLKATVRTLNGAQVQALSGSHFSDSLDLTDVLLDGPHWMDPTQHPTGTIPLYELHRGNLAPIHDLLSGDQYLGLRLPVQGAWQYTWLRYTIIGYSTHWGSLQVPEYGWKGGGEVVAVDESVLWPAPVLFPSLAREHLWFRPPSHWRESIHFQMFDATGKCVVDEEQIFSASRHFAVGDWPRGTYLVRMVHAGQPWHQRVVLE